MCVCHYCAILSELLTYDTAATLSTTNISNANLLTDNTSNLSAAATTHLSAAASGNLSAPTNSSTTTELTSKQNPKTEIDLTKLEIIDNSLPTDPQFFHTTHRILTMKFGHQNYLSLLVTSEDTQPNNLETNQHPTLTSNILPAIITENESLDAIFPFELEELSTILLFSRAALEEKPITTMYTNMKVNGHVIKLILDSRSADSHQVDCAASTHIITADRATKIPIGKIDDFSFKVNSIITPIKVLVIKATQYQALHNELPPVPSWDDNTKKKQKEELTWNANQDWKTNHESEEPTTWEWDERGKGKRKAMKVEPLPTAIYTPYIYTPTQQLSYYNKLCFVCGTILSDEEMWNNIPEHGGTCDEMCQYTILINDWHCDNWKDKIKNNSLSLLESEYVQTFNIFGNIEDDLEEFHEYYQQLYCNECDLIYNPPPHMIYMIPEEKELINSCASESELTFNLDSNSDNNDDENNSFSSAPNNNKNYDNLNSNSNSETFIALFDLSKKQKLK
ncbi:hypothetical protein G9A89_019890 [Geosiphon pyriformis]|nr:hypothetical protein G9A89_019890 [Geosiphon pyriformis]